jgi:DNA-binding Lrp family transcriptional regulator
MCIAFDQRAATSQAAFKTALQQCEHVVTSCELTGSFDFMLEAALPNIAAYNEKLDGMKAQLAQLVTRYEANLSASATFVSQMPGVSERSGCHATKGRGASVVQTSTRSRLRVTTCESMPAERVG